MKKGFIFTILLLFPIMTNAELLTNWIEHVGNPIYSGSNSKAYYPTVIKDSNSSYKMWYTGSGGIFYATSNNGTSWTPGNGGNAITGLTNPHHIVVRYNKTKSLYQAWYWNTSQLYSAQSIRYAESSDGLSWNNDRSIAQSSTKPIITGNSGDWNRGSYGPSDVILNSSASNSGDDPWNYSYVMYYDATTGGRQDIGLAYSSDGVTWTRNGDSNADGLVLARGDASGANYWDAAFAGRSSVYKENDQAFHMWYSGGASDLNDGIGYAFSTNGVDWVKEPNPIFHVNDNVTWRTKRTYTPVVVDGKEMWFTGDDGTMRGIGYATVVPEPSAITLLFGVGTVILTLRRIFRI